MQYGTIAATLLALAGSGAATMQEQPQQQNSYQPPPGSCWQGMQQSQDMMKMGVAIISNNDGGMNNKWNMVAQQSNYMGQQGMNGQVHQVTVGGPKGLVFDPPTINAQPGDMVQFNFMDKNHTVTQSTFDKPCVKMQGGMDSGFMPNPTNMIQPPPAMKVQVMNSMPMWFYCRQKQPKPHCGSGMAFSINPTPQKSQQMFVQMAMQQNGTGSMMAPPPSNVAMPQSNVQQGQGTVQNGQCSCSCLCGTNAYAPGLGLGQMGGLGGMIPASGMMGAPAPMSPAPASGAAPAPAPASGAPSPPA